jgi:hypothetical protein
MYQVWVNRHHDDVDLSHVVDRVNVFDINMASITSSFMLDGDDDERGCVECGKTGGRDGKPSDHEHDDGVSMDVDTTDIKTSFLSRFTPRRAKHHKSLNSGSSGHKPGCSRYPHPEEDQRTGTNSGSRHQKAIRDLEDQRSAADNVRSVGVSQQDRNSRSIYDFDDNDNDDDGGAFVRSPRGFGASSFNTFASSIADDGEDADEVVDIVTNAGAEESNKSSRRAGGGGGVNRHSLQGDELERRRSIAAIAEFNDDELGPGLLRKASNNIKQGGGKYKMKARGLRRRLKRRMKRDGQAEGDADSPGSQVSSKGGNKLNRSVENPLFRTRARTMSAGL